MNDEERPQVFSPRELLLARAIVSQLIDPISVTLGLLRVIPLSERQRDIIFFESFFGINRKSACSFEDIAQKWRIGETVPRRAINRIWKKLRVARSPISDTARLQDLLGRIKTFERMLGEDILISPVLPNFDRQLQADFERFSIK